MKEEAVEIREEAAETPRPEAKKVEEINLKKAEEVNIKEAGEIDISQFSRTKKKFALVCQNDIPYLIKEISLKNLAGKHSLQFFYEQILEYIYLIRQAGIPLPEIAEHSRKDDKLSFTCRYHGKNFLQLAQNPARLVGEMLPLVKKAVRILRQAQEANLSLDPNLKYFCSDEEGKVYFVDFSPPYGLDYREQNYDQIVIRATAPEHQAIVAQNLECFKPENLGFHFAGDLLKEDPAYEEIMPGLYQLLVEERVVSVPYHEFLQRAHQVKKIELDRIGRGLRLS